VIISWKYFEKRLQFIRTAMRKLSLQRLL